MENHHFGSHYEKTLPHALSGQERDEQNLDSHACFLSVA